MMELSARELRTAARGEEGPVDLRLLARIPEPDPDTTPRTALNRLCGPDAWADPAWLMVNPALRLPDGDHRYHRKAFEWTHCAYGLEQLGALRGDARVLGVAAGHECLLYYLANRVGRVVAVDLYRGAFSGGLATEADPMFLHAPWTYAPFPYRTDALTPMPADALHLPFADASFDVVFSLSSIEHFGGHGGSARGMREMARVLRSGGVLCVATEWILAGGDDAEFFTPAAFRRHVVDTPGVALIGDLDETPPAAELVDDPVWVSGDVERTPHLVMGRGPLRWTSVVVFLRRTG